jgi:hypothetical protein
MKGEYITKDKDKENEGIIVEGVWLLQKTNYVHEGE